MKKLVEVSIFITIQVLKYNFSTYKTTLNNSLIEFINSMFYTDRTFTILKLKNIQ